MSDDEEYVAEDGNTVCMDLEFHSHESRSQLTDPRKQEIDSIDNLSKFEK